MVWKSDDTRLDAVTNLEMDMSILPFFHMWQIRETHETWGRALFSRPRGCGPKPRWGLHDVSFMGSQLDTFYP